MRPVSFTRRRSQGGFALLLIALMAAIAALMLYRELPRAAFQSQRQKEQMLMERGEEYKHAIGVFYRNNGNRWPASLDELESFNGKRYLRRRYIDPMTGKDEWRLIHINGGVLTDSINSKPPSTQQASNGTGIVSETQLFNNGVNGQSAVNPALRRRPSDGGAQLNADGTPIAAGVNPMPGTPTIPGFPGVPGATGTTGLNPGIPGMGAFPGGVTPGVTANGTNGAPGATGTTATNGNTGQNAQNGSSGGGGVFGSSSGGGLFGSAPTTGPTTGANPQQPGIPGLQGQPPLPGAAPNGMIPSGGSGAPGGINISPQSQTAAAGLIQGLLTTPRPGGLAGIQAAQQQSANTIGGGIAGVASKFDADSIMLYSDKQNYAEWEFVYDPSKWKRPPPPTSGIGLGAPNTGGVFGSGSASGSSGSGGSGSSTTSSAGTPLPAGQAMGSFPGSGFGSPPAAAGATNTGSPFGNSFSSGSGSGNGMGGSPGTIGGAPGMGAPVGTSGIGTPGNPGAPGTAGAVMPGSTGFGGGGGIDIRPGRANW